MGLLNMMNQLTTAYAEMSTECVYDLCTKAGVAYKEPKDSEILMKDLQENGRQLKVVKYKHDDVAVGQYVVLTDLEDKVIYGYTIWIDLQSYTVRKRNIESGTDLSSIMISPSPLVN